MSRSYLKKWLSVALSVLVASSIIITHPQPSYGQSWLNLLLRGVQVIQLSNLSDSQEVRIGQQINQQLIRSRQMRPSRNTALNQTINRIGQRLAKTSDRPNIPYTFQVLEDRSVNAFATMGGFVYVNTGLIAKAENEAELASVIAHEIGHVAARHAVTQMRDVALSQGLMSAAGLNESTMVQLGVQLAVNLPNSREDEHEADRLGLRNLQRGGYAPVGMVTFMQKLMQQGGSAPAFLSSHPATSARVTTLSRAIKASEAYQGDGLDARDYQRNVRSLL